MMVYQQFKLRNIVEFSRLGLLDLKIFVRQQLGVIYVDSNLYLVKDYYLNLLVVQLRETYYIRVLSIFLIYIYLMQYYK